MQGKTDWIHTQNTEYFVLTQMIIDNVHLFAGKDRENQLGGGTYAVAGMRLWSDKVGFCCRLGLDYDGNYEEWFSKNNIDMPKTRYPKKCVHADINYFEDGEREEILIPGCGNYMEMLPRFTEIPEDYLKCKGMYFYKDGEEAYWEEAENWFRGFSGISCWEIDSESARIENKEAIAFCLPKVNLFSTNLTEGKRMTGKEKPVDIVKGLHDMGAGVLIFRMGEKGALVSDGKQIWHIPAVPVDVVDVTGGGNASTGGFLTGYCDSGGDIVYAGICAAISASRIIAQYSVPARFDEQLMIWAEKKAVEMKGKCERI